MTKQISIIILLFIFVFYLLNGEVNSSDNQRKDFKNDLSMSGPADPAEMEAFFNNIITKQMEARHIPGAVISVVKDGKLFFTKGYGYANLEKHIPFQPDKTLVRIASVTKLFTWTAVMQLVEQGKLDLNSDVNTYLTTFKIPNTYPEPITLLNLMAHSAGLEDRNIGTGARRIQDVPQLGEYLAKHMPARVCPPGLVSAYSNYGAALAGYIAAQVSGMPYEQYIQKNILDPLSMHHTIVYEPLPENLEKDLAFGYKYINGKNVPFPFFYDITRPDGSISATAIDMSHFMIAHLQNGNYNGIRILKSDTAKLMHGQSFTQNPYLPGWAHGFEELYINNQHVISHTGGKEGYDNILILMPEHNIGLFVSFNSYDGFKAIDNIIHAFFDHYFPTSHTFYPSKNINQSVKQFSGWYKSTVNSKSTIEKLAALLSSSRMFVLNDHTLEFNGHKWEVIESMLYHEKDGNDLMAFLPNKQGKTLYIAIGTNSFEKVPCYETISFTLLLLGSFILLSLSTIIGWSINFFILLKKERLKYKLQITHNAARFIAFIGCVLSIVFIIILGIMLGGDISIFTFGVPLYLYFLFLIPIIVAVITTAVIIWTIIIWREKYWNALHRIHYTIVMLALIGFVWFTNTWNLLGFHFG